MSILSIDWEACFTQNLRGLAHLFQHSKQTFLYFVITGQAWKDWKTVKLQKVYPTFERDKSLPSSSRHRPDWPAGMLNMSWFVHQTNPERRFLRDVLKQKLRKQ